MMMMMVESLIVFVFTEQQESGRTSKIRRFTLYSWNLKCFSVTLCRSATAYHLMVKVYKKPAWASGNKNDPKTHTTVRMTLFKVAHVDYDPKKKGLNVRHLST